MIDPRHRPARPRPEAAPAPAEPDYSDPTMPPPTPRRLASAAVVVWVLLVTCGILFGAGLDRLVFTAGIAGLQVLTVVGYVLHRRPPGPFVVAGAGLVAALGADLVMLYTDPFDPGGLVYVLAGAFGVAVIGQFFRGEAREKLTVSMGAAAYLAVLAAAYSGFIGLLRHPGGQAALWTCVIAAGTAVMTARAIDLTIPKPRINRQVPRGAFGVVIGGMVGTAAAAYAGVLLDGPTPDKAAMGGLVIGLVAVLGDLSAGYSHAGRRIDGDGVAPWPVRHGLGPLLAFATVAPVVYLLSVYYIVRGL
ncbi:hypothetical protein [Stackebrandtia albiflava]|nr:hypothetical protein [Stackebrandtia albiflava]